jgi:hypothetical protein
MSGSASSKETQIDAVFHNVAVNLRLFIRRVRWLDTDDAYVRAHAQRIIAKAERSGLDEELIQRMRATILRTVEETLAEPTTGEPEVCN